MGGCYADDVTPIYPEKFAIYSPTSGCSSASIIPLPSKIHGILVVGLERGPLGLVTINEELLD
jgi:hypothetical protein